MKSKIQKITIGTKEWADSNVNCYYGCSNNCRYCYAKKMAIRFGRKTKENWKIMVPNQKAIFKNYNKRTGRVMFPTSHDITLESLENSIIVLQKLLKAENEVLITTKPNLYCVKKICERFKDNKDSIQFRFTITSINKENLDFWEPGAPSLEERLDSLKYAYDNEYKTSISIEPFLDSDPYILVEKLRPFVTESIWIGKMNYIRVANLTPYEKKFYNRIKMIVAKENLIKIVKKSSNYNKDILRIKDSIFNFLLS